MSETTLDGYNVQPTSQQQTIGSVIAGLFAVVGIGVIAVFIFTVLNDTDVTQASSRNQTILTFLDSYGLITPLLALGIGLAFMNFSRQLFARDIVTSGWAQLAMLWTMVFALVVLVVHIFQVATTNIGATVTANRVDFNVPLAVGLVITAAVAGGVWWWLTQNRKVVFNEGEETISTRESLVAWNLLIPTVAVMLLVAARPLERTFIGSLTDRTFAGSAEDEVNFIGLQNYYQLLAFRIDATDCVRDEGGECTTQIIENEFDEVVTLPVDLDSIAALEPAVLDVGIDFFNAETVTRLLEENQSFADGLALAAQAAIEEETGESVGEVTVDGVVEGNVLAVTVDGEAQEIAVTERLTNLEGLDLADIDLNYTDDVSLAGLNTYRLRSRTLRGELENIALGEYDVENDATIDDVSVDGFEDFSNMGITVTRLETGEEIVYENPRDTVGEAYRNYSAVNTFNLFNNRYVLSARDAAFFNSIGNTLFFTFVTVVAELILGLIIAVTVNSEFPGRGLMRAAMLIPWAIPTVVSAKLWEYMLLDNRTGVINDVLIRTGIIESSVSWIANADTRIWALIFVDVWKTTPFMALLILAGLQTIPSDVYEAADVDGAGPIRKFFSITLPLLRPTIAVALVFRTLDAVRAFDVFDVLVGRQLQSMATYNQFVLVETQEFGYASAIGVTMFVIILVFTIIYVRALGVDTD